MRVRPFTPREARRLRRLARRSWAHVETDPFSSEAGEALDQLTLAAPPTEHLVMLAIRGSER